MEITILEDKKTRLVFEMKGEDHTFCNVLREEMWNDSSVKLAAYNIVHPLTSIPKFILETDSKKAARKALSDAMKRLKDKNSSLKKLAAKFK
ncbi:MAG: DNA-directed RNA polymerase subunit L [Nanoarchaeota archaeon]|nr:DNA-directed RNA polymerase subunit L [Nanoarchaeota archaeon]